MSDCKYRFVFIVGAEGSGTTLLTRILSRPEGTVALGGNYTTVRKSEKEAWSLVEQFDKANTDLWDRQGNHERHRQARDELPRVVERLLRLDSYARVSHVIFKRSAPFFEGDRWRPDLSDLLDLFEDLRMVAIYRDPRACTFSAFRRGFREGLRQCAVVSEEQLTYLAAQLGTLDEYLYRIIAYEELCSRPGPLLEELAGFCGLPAAGVLAAVEEENLKPAQNERWRRELDPSAQNFLEGFFDGRRVAQWRLLADTAAAGFPAAPAL